MSAENWVHGVTIATSVFTSGVLVPVVRSWKRNRHAGKERDALIDALTANVGQLAASVQKSAGETKDALRDLSAQVSIQGKTAWELSADMKAVKDRLSVQDRELERVKDRLDSRNGRPLP